MVRRALTLTGIILLLLLILSSCSSVRYVPVETVRTDSLYFTKVERDSVYVRDSVSVLVKGDTVFKEKLRYKYVFMTKSDTAYISRIDTVRVPYPVEAQIKAGQRAWMWTGKIAAVCLALAVVGLVIYKKIA